MKRSLTMAMIGCLLALPAGAQSPTPWTGPDLSATPGDNDISFALTEACFPFLAGVSTPEDILKRARVKRTPNVSMKRSAGAMITINTSVSVNLGLLSGQPNMCIAQTAGGAASDQLLAALQSLERWPQSLILAKTQKSNPGFAMSLFFCTPADGDQITAEILAGDGRGGADQKGIIVSLLRGQNRAPRCDNDLTPRS